MPENKLVAADFLEMVGAGRIDEAYEKHVEPSGKHHNPFFPAGFASLRKAMIENHNMFPNMALTVKHLLGEGDLVAVQSHIVLTPRDAGVMVVHLFRFQGGRIMEIWDCGQPIPPNSPNADGAF